MKKTAALMKLITAAVLALVLEFRGSLGIYDRETWEVTYVSEYGLYRLTISEDCVFLSSGGTDPDKVVDAAYFNSCFNDPTGLSMTVVIENGEVVQLVSAS